MIGYARAVLHVKAADGPTRRISGIATTPATDREGDSIDPLGARFTNPIPLLWHHDRKKPIGLAMLHAPTRDGIRFDATIPTVDEPGPLRDRIEEAWQSLKVGLIWGVSVGYRALDGGIQRLKNGGRRFTQTEICEVSLLTIPSNMQATIDVVKSLDEKFLAAVGLDYSGDSERSHVPAHKGAARMTTQEKITQFENSRAAKVARMGLIMADVPDDGLPDDKREEYDGLALDVKSIDGNLTRLNELEKLQTASATRVEASPSGIRTTTPVVTVKSNAAPGLTWVRSIKSLLQANGDSYRAMQYAKQYGDSNVELLIKAAVAPGSTTDPAWAGALVTVGNLTGEFIELSRAATILGRLPLKKVPFNTSIPVVTAGGTYKWVGQGKPKPVSKMQFGTTSVGMSKAAGIMALTEELVRSSSPSAELIVRDEMVRGIQLFLDQQFVDPAVAAVADVSPASITNGATTAASLDDPSKDLGLIVNHFSAAGIPLSKVALIMSETNAYAMGASKNALGGANFPAMSATGGNANGLTVVASNTVGQLVIGVATDYILLADDGGVKVDVSREASIQMNDAPVSPADPATTVWSSLWQDNLVGIRAERFINWKRAITPAVYYLTGAVYPV